MSPKFQDGSSVTMPSLEEVRRYISHLESLQLQNIPYDELMSLTTSYFPYLPVFTGTFAPELTFFRVRLNITAEPYNKVQDIGIPPASVLTGFGRANKPFQPMFYASWGPEVALIEACQVFRKGSRATPGFATIGVWGLHQDTTLELINVVSNKEAQHSRPDIRNIAEFYKTITNYETVQFNRATEEAKSVASLIVSHIADTYARPEVTCHHDYKLSVVYADRILSEDSEGIWDGINYPSVAKKYLGDNIVLRQSAFRKLRLIGAYFVSYAYLRDEQEIVSQVLSTATVGSDATLLWL